MWKGSSASCSDCGGWWINCCNAADAPADTQDAPQRPATRPEKELRRPSTRHRRVDDDLAPGHYQFHTPPFSEAE